MGVKEHESEEEIYEQMSFINSSFLLKFYSTPNAEEKKEVKMGGEWNKKDFLVFPTRDKWSYWRKCQASFISIAKAEIMNMDTRKQKPSHFTYQWYYLEKFDYSWENLRRLYRLHLTMSWSWNLMIEIREILTV